LVDELEGVDLYVRNNVWMSDEVEFATDYNVSQ
jgi:hypothetical protein